MAETAGYNRCTFYQYFTDVYDLLDQAEDQLLNDIMAYLHEAVTNDVPEELLAHAAKAYSTFSYPLSILLGPNGSPSFQRKYKQAMKPFLFRQFRLAQDDPMTDLVCEYCLGAFLTSVSYWYRQKQPISPEALASFLYTAMQEGIYSYLIPPVQ